MAPTHSRLLDVPLESVWLHMCQPQWPSRIIDSFIRFPRGPRPCLITVNQTKRQCRLCWLTCVIADCIVKWALGIVPSQILLFAPLIQTLLKIWGPFTEVKRQWWVFIKRCKRCLNQKLKTVVSPQHNDQITNHKSHDPLMGRMQVNLLSTFWKHIQIYRSITGY